MCNINKKGANTMKKATSCIGGLIAGILLILIDQWTKYMAVLHLKEQPAFVLWKGVFELQYLENKGAAFGMLQGKKWFFIVISVLFILALCYFYLRIPSGKKFWALRVIAIFLFAGSVGNLIDRILHNYVIDFFYLKCIDFPVFNVADIYVTVFCGLLILLILFYYKEEDLAAIFSQRKKISSVNNQAADTTGESDKDKIE